MIRLYIETHKGTKREWTGWRAVVLLTAIWLVPGLVLGFTIGVTL